MLDRRVDTHTHQVPRAFKRAVELETGMTFPLPAVEASEHLAAMDGYGIGLAVISMPPPGVSLGTRETAVRLARLANEEYASIVDQHSGRFVALAALPVPDVEAALAELEYALDVLGLAGVALLTSIDGVYVGDRRLDPLLAALDRRGAYVLLHPCDPPAQPLPQFPGWLFELPFETTRAVTSLLYSGSLARYRRIRWQLPHVGGALPILAHRLAGLVQREPRLAKDVGGDPLELLGQLYLDTAQADNEPALAATLAFADPDRLVFGTDFPFAPLAVGSDPQPALDALGERIRDAVDRDNPLRLIALSGVSS